MATVTCHTTGCAKENEPVPDVRTMFENEDGETQYVAAVFCGACSQPIMDIQPPIPSYDPPPPS